MNMCNFFLLPCLLLFSRAEASLFGSGLFQCHFTSSGDVLYLAKIFFNKVLWADYNSTLGKYTGYTEKAIEFANDFNKNPAFMKQEKKNLEICKSHVCLFFTVIEPSVKLRSVEALGSRHPSMLICSVYNFYPKQIRLRWLRNGKEVTSDVTSTDELPNGNWLYQMHSQLELTHSFGDKIACQVEHASFVKPKIYDWDPISEAERNKIAVGTAALLLGLVFFGVGLIYYIKKKNGLQLVPTSTE
ncbi:rano class II histocompatibility antigen, A beta chain-like [Notolabrus celidotus]|uniref:rano class II histocompatibility antigen, A beta chain-like n=1 Tax=Notolabrus celidotus TaxID=1203425 RepID=UPI00149088AB|nr:rano class II histocompatibility antigen, A beta chain-like [Notolabrus celidotus]